MNPFHYHASTSTADALEFASHEARVKFLAGGTTLVDLMKLGVERPASLVDITPLPLNEIIDERGTLLIGAMVRNSDLAYNAEVPQPVIRSCRKPCFPARFRNSATWPPSVGTFCNEPAALTFAIRNSHATSATPGSGCGAIDGFHRMHAILGTSEECIATHASDMCVAFAALDATIVVEGSHGERRIRLNDFYLTPETSPPDHENLLEQGDLITAVEIPPTPFAKRSHYFKVRDRARTNWRSSPRAWPWNSKEIASFRHTWRLAASAPSRGVRTRLKTCSKTLQRTSNRFNMPLTLRWRALGRMPGMLSRFHWRRRRLFVLWKRRGICHEHRHECQ